MSMVCASAGGHVDVTCFRVMTKGHVDVCELCCSLKLCWCPGDILLPGTILVLMAMYQSPFRCLWPVLPSEDMLRSVACANDRDHVYACGS